MATPANLSDGLRETLLQVLRTPPPQKDLTRMVNVCHALALTTLRQRQSGRFASELHDISPAQLAYDCIADLFAQQDGRLVKIASYFETFEPDTLTDAQVLQHLRRLVGGSLHQSLFRIFGEIDPSLGKILRNVKLAVQSLGHFRTVDRFGEPCIAPAFCDPLDHLDACPREELERGVLGNAARLRTVPDLLSALGLFLRTQSEYSRVVSTIDTASVFRSVFARLAEQESASAQIPDQLAPGDIQAVITWACETVRARMQKTYVTRGRITGETLTMYNATIERYLQAKLDGEGDNASLRSQFLALFPDLPHSAFSMHRSRLEYMTRLAERLIHRRLRE